MTAYPAPPSGDADRVVVHASLRGLAAAVVTPLLLTLIGGAALVDGGVRLFPLTLLIGGVVLGGVALADLPRRSEFTLAGIDRVCWLRRHHLPWRDVVAVDRANPGTAARTRNLVDRREDRERSVAGGLVARGRGPRRWLLTDRVESRDEHDRLAALLDRLDAPVQLRAPRPHGTAPPTDLYRRRRRP